MKYKLYLKPDYICYLIKDYDAIKDLPHYYPIIDNDGLVFNLKKSYYYKNISINNIKIYSGNKHKKDFIIKVLE